MPTTPTFIRYEPGPTLTRDERDKYMKYDNLRRYGRVDISQQGYNAQNPSVMVVKVRLDTDGVNLRPRLDANNR
jgi:hypothetical protein